MKNLLRKYFEMSEKEKEGIEYIYIFNELLSIIGEKEFLKIKNQGDFDMLMMIIERCMLHTDICVDAIITNIFEVLNCSDMSINDIYELEKDEMLEILFTEDNYEIDLEDEQIVCDKGIEYLGNFEYLGMSGLIIKANEKFVIIFIKNDNYKVLVLDNEKDLELGVLENKLEDLELDELYND